MCDVTSARCIELKGIGDSCEAFYQCASYICDLEDGVCVEASFQLNGASCEVDYDCLSFLCDSGICATPVYLDNGAACEESEQCRSFNCENGECTDLFVQVQPSLLDIGARCTENADCYTLSCEAGSCVDPFAATVAAQPCGVDEYVHDNMCKPCAAGTTSRPGSDPSSRDTECSPVLCEVNQYAFAHTCQDCPFGSTAPAGADTSSPRTTHCSPIVVTGMCAGNTNVEENVHCGENLLLKPDAESIRGSSTADCCVRKPAAPPEETYVWEASPWSECAFGCGQREPASRTVMCMKIVTYESGITDPPSEVPAQMCQVEEMPETVRECEILPAGTPCSDGRAETTNDRCTERAPGAQCAGVVAMASRLLFEASVEDGFSEVALPSPTATPAEINASPAAVAIKEALLSELAPAFGAETTIVIISITGGSLIVDYRVEVPLGGATAENKAAALDSLSDGLSTDIILPMQDGNEMQLPDPIPAPMVSYAYFFTAATCPFTCSNDCGQVAITRSDLYTCLIDGTPGALSACHQTLGPPPETRTTCCPASDPLTCRAPMPILSASFSRNQDNDEVPSPRDDDTDDETGDQRVASPATSTSTRDRESPTVLIVVALVAGVVVLVLVAVKLTRGNGTENNAKQATDLSRQSLGLKEAEEGLRSSRLKEVEEGVRSSTLEGKGGSRSSMLTDVEDASGDSGLKETEEGMPDVEDASGNSGLKETEEGMPPARKGSLGSTQQHCRP